MELPHTKGCLVCGRDNPHGLHLTFSVDPVTGIVSTTFTPAAHHIGFENLIHGGILATVLDEIMVWTAIWASGRACVAAELSLRFIQKVAVGEPLRATASITRHRSRLIETTGELRTAGGVVCTATAKYAPLGLEASIAFANTFLDQPSTMEAKAILHARGRRKEI